MGLDFFLCVESVVSGDGILCLLALSLFLGVPAGVFTGEGIGVLERGWKVGS